MTTLLSDTVQKQCRLAEAQARTWKVRFNIIALGHNYHQARLAEKVLRHKIEKGLRAMLVKTQHNGANSFTNFIQFCVQEPEMSKYLRSSSIVDN